MKFMQKLFGGLKISWWKLIVFAVICGVYTGVMALLPMARDTSFQDISITFECWVLFAIILIVNAKSPLDSALKVFVFFLISQPLVYLVQVPFHEMGWQLFKYYPPWFRWTLLTFPMAFVGWYMKKDKWWGLLILSPMLAFVGYHYYGFFGEAVHVFPHHLLSAVFCAATMIIYPLFIFRNKKIRMVGLAISLALLVGFTVFSFLDGNDHAYHTQLLSSGGETCGIEYDDSYRVYLADESFGTVEIKYLEMDNPDDNFYIISAAFTDTGDTELILESPEGEKYVYDLYVGRDTYRVHRQGADEETTPAQDDLTEAETTEPVPAETEPPVEETAEAAA